MRHKDVNNHHKIHHHDHSPNVMRFPINDLHSMELTFTDGETQYRIVDRYPDGNDKPINVSDEPCTRSPAEIAFGGMRDIYDYYLRSIATWHRSGKRSDKIKMLKLRRTYNRAVDRWVELQ
jgi:hypothetical protein